MPCSYVIVLFEITVFSASCNFWWLHLHNLSKSSISDEVLFHGIKNMQIRTCSNHCANWTEKNVGKKTGTSLQYIAPKINWVKHNIPLKWRTITHRHTDSQFTYTHTDKGSDIQRVRQNCFSFCFLLFFFYTNICSHRLFT